MVALGGHRAGAVAAGVVDERRDEPAETPPRRLDRREIGADFAGRSSLSRSSRASVHRRGVIWQVTEDAGDVRLG